MAETASPMRRLGLRSRVIIAFAVGALLLSALLSAVTFSLTRANLLDQRVDDVRTSAILNARNINLELGRVAFLQADAGEEPISLENEAALADELIQQFTVPRGASQGLRVREAIYWADETFDATALPASLTTAISTSDETTGLSTPSEMVFDGDTGSFYAIALPLPFADVSSTYIQSASLAEIEDSLRNLRATLIGASAVTTIMGLGFGIYVATRIFNPLGEISAAAEQIADGDLSTRLDDGDDPDLDRLVTSFNGMTTALQERIERDSRFASDVSHELRSPLMTLTGSAAVLEKRRDEMPERAQIALDLLTADIRRFKQLVEDLLEISRFDVGAVELDKDEVLVTEFVRQAMHAATGGTREIPIVHGADAEDLIALIDKRRIAQVMRNLSENADKYADGVTQVHINRAPDNGLRIELEDEGPGVPDDERELIFERFSRGSEGGRRGSGSGVGLGLSLVVEHLRLHGGRVWVTDRVDSLRGARFVIELDDVVVDE